MKESVNVRMLKDVNSDLNKHDLEQLLKTFHIRFIAQFNYLIYRV